MSATKIAPCPFCGERCIFEHGAYSLTIGSTAWGLTCTCGYSSATGRGDTQDEAVVDAIAAHNKVATRLDPARILMMLGGTVGNKVSRHGMFHPLFINGIRYAMEKIRDMRDAK